MNLTTHPWYAPRYEMPEFVRRRVQENTERRTLLKIVAGISIDQSTGRSSYANPPTPTSSRSLVQEDRTINAITARQNFQPAFLHDTRIFESANTSTASGGAKAPNKHVSGKISFVVVHGDRHRTEWWWGGDSLHISQLRNQQVILSHQFHHA